VSVSGNTISTAQRNGIVLTSDEEGVTITGNIIDGVIEGGSTQNGISVLGSPQGTIVGNWIGNLTGVNGAGINFSVASSLAVASNNFFNVTSNVFNGQYQSSPPSKTVTVTGPSVSVNLSGVEAVVFNQSSPSTITAFTGVVSNALYRFYFMNGNTTIDRASAYLDGSVSQTGTANDVMLVYGRSTTTISQAAPMSVNG
jgi:hypothetical protein